MLLLKDHLKYFILKTLKLNFLYTLSVSHGDDALKKEEQTMHSYHTVTSPFSRQTWAVFTTNPTLQQKCSIFYSFFE